MAAIWRGNITFGLVNIPVELRGAVRSDNISFRLLHAEDLSPVRYERVCQEEDETVPWDEIVKGYEYEKGKFVVMTDDDFKTAALEQSKTIDILDFVKQEEIDPRFFETPYYLIPGNGGDKAYALLREAMKRTESVGVGKIIIRQKQHLAAIKVVGDALVLELMRFSHELVDPAEYSFPESDGVRPQEVQMAEQLIGNLAQPFDPTKYTDEYRANLMRIIRAKMKGKEPKLEGPRRETEDTGVIDLMSRLRQSLEQGRDGGRARGRRTAKERPGTGERTERSGRARTRKTVAARSTARSRKRKTA
jgi:DNA end-binding protein Ku